MKNDSEMSNKQFITQSISNIEQNNKPAINSPTTIYTKPAEILMSLILPTVSNRLKYHQELMKLKESKT